MRKLIFALFSLVYLSAHAQDPATIRIRITSPKNEPVAYATISVLSVPDTLAKQQKSADSTGVAVFDLVLNHPYLVRISSVDYQPLEKSITVKSAGQQFNFTAKPSSTSLNNIVVTTRKPLMRQEDDKTIIDPEPIAAASTNAYEILEKTPGLFVDQDGNVYLSSMTPAQIYINGRQMKMSAADIATMLKNLPPDAIQKIEVVRTPSAKYDASGSGGIVNIVLKKGVKLGMTGSVNAGMQQGTYGNQFIGFNLTNNDGKKNSYINLNFSNRNSYDRYVTNRLFTKDSVLQQNAYTTYPAHSYFVAYGISDSLGSKWFVDFAGSATYHVFDNQTQTQNFVESISTGLPSSNSLNRVEYKGNYLRLSNGIDFVLKIDSASDWSNDFYFSYDRNRINQQYNTLYYTPFLPTTNGFGSPDNDRDYFTFTSDLKKRLKGRILLEAGVKAAITHFTSDASYFNGLGSGAVKDFSRTNTFTYNEDINAAYLQASKTFGKDIVLKAGVRLENTNMMGHQTVPSDTSFSLHRTDPFPYIYLSKKIMTIAGYDLRAYLVYRRTIARPVYEQLNPFPKFVDQYLTEQGNPRLRPQFTTNYEANISVNERPIIAVGINDTKDIFTQVIYPSDSSRRTSIRTYDNPGHNKEWYLRGLGAIPPGKRYFFVLGAQYNHNFYQGLYNGVAPLSFQKGTWTLFTYHQLKLDKLSQFMLHGFVRFNGQQQFYELSTFGQLNASLNRQFMKQKLTITVSMNDILNTNKNNFTLQQGTINAYGFRESDNRRFGINVRYNFGIQKKKEENNMFNMDAPKEKP